MYVTVDVVHKVLAAAVVCDEARSQILTAVAVVHPHSALAAAAASSSSAQHDSNNNRRQRRDIFHLYNMMQCTTQCDPLSYKGT